jgi:hypothetical protein
MGNNNIDKHRIIGITGKKFCGKDTLGNFFVENKGYQKIAYADALKDAVKAIFDFDDEQLNGSKKEVVDEFWNKTPRQVLQFVGTDLFRNHTHEIMPNIGKDIWCQVVKRKILNKLNENPNAKFVVTDARFQNEVDVVKQLGGTVIKLYRNTGCIDNHESESLIDSLYCDYQYENNSSKEDLYQQVVSELNI